MAKVFLGKEAVPIYGWTEGVQVEEQALTQLRNTAALPFIYKHIAVMPDVHLGYGATIGSVVPTIGAIVPAAVGVDIGCGMMAVRTSIKADHLPDNLHEIRTAIEAVVPVGFDWFKETPEANAKVVDAMLPELTTILDSMNEPVDKHTDKVANQLGTLGGGNHFIELCVDECNDVWVMLHTGSRGIGNMIGTTFISKAKELMEKWFINLPDKDLAYLPDGTKEFNDYVKAVHWAQEYALKNRELMMGNILTALRKFFPDLQITEGAVACHHNYIALENHYDKNVWLTRKGAVRARLGELGIIPGSMGAKSFIVRGKGNKESFCSCSHGAGRMMSRGEASKSITIEEHEAATKGVECRKDKGVLDESPAAYKDIDRVMAAQLDLVDIVHTLKQVVCVKG